jgi:hypothetical protein
VFPPAAPLLVVGAALAGMAAAREDRPVLGGAIYVIALGSGSAFAGPAGVWRIIAVGGCLLGIVYASVQAWQRSGVTARA